MTTEIKAPELSRRGLLAGLSGLSFCFAFGVDGLRLVPEAQAADAVTVSPWVRITPDGTITILTPGAEMGQGSMTSLPLILAEEMDADWDKVVLEWAPADPEIYGYKNGNSREMSIVGSRAVMFYFEQLRIAGAQVRKVLLVNAAEKWGVDAKALRTEPSAVVNPATGQRFTYGEIAAFGKVPATLPDVAASELKPRSQFRLIGKSLPRRDIPLKVNGSAQYAIDTALPGMLYASALHSPVHGDAPESWNDNEIKAMPGVVATVKLRDGVGIVADTFEQAMAARRAVKASWKKGKADGFNSGRALEDYVKFNVDPTSKTQMVDARGRLIPLSQVRPYLVAARSRQHDFGPRFAVARAILSHSGCRLSATRRLSDCRVGLSRIGAAGDVPIAHRFMMRGKAEHSFERDVPVKAAIVAKDEFFEICVDVLAAKAMIGAQSPPLHQREDPMNPRQHDMAAILPTVRGSCR